MTNATDIEFVLNQIKTGQIEEFDSLLEKSINSKLIGVLGHSLGGAAALQACRATSSIKAGINIDGKIFPSSEKEDVVVQPFLIISAGGEKINPAITEKREEWEAFQQKHPLSSRTDIPYATHGDFKIVPLYLAKETGKVDENFAEITRTTNKEILSFFNEHLK